VKLLLDTNIILDVLLKRHPYGDSALKILAQVEKGEISGYLCGTTVTTIDYIVRKHLGTDTARQCISSLLTIFDIAPVNRPVLLNALALDFPDFEDAVLHESAKAVCADGIITRNLADFKKSVLPVFGPDELVAMMSGRSLSSE
jgi:predicted nucleic acid-binding protein